MDGILEVVAGYVYGMSQNKPEIGNQIKDLST